MDYGEVDVVDTHVCYDGFFRLDKYRVRHALFAGGMSEIVSREVFERGHAVAMLPYDPVRDEVVMLEQFRIGAVGDRDGPWLTEIVAGMIGEGERCEDVARRESVEESGCAVQDLMPILRYFVSPGGSTETIQLYCGKVDATKADGIHGLDEEGEDIRVLTVPFREALDWIGQGRIISAAPIIALQWLAMNHDEVRRRWAE